MGFIELFKVIGNRIKNAMEVTFSNQDFVGEDVVENLEIAVLTTSEVDNKEGSELIQKLREVEKRNKKGKSAETSKKFELCKKRSTGGKGKGGKGMANIAMQDATIKSIKDGVTTSGKYDKTATQTKGTPRTEGRLPSEREE